MFAIYRIDDPNFGNVEDIVLVNNGLFIWIPKDESNRQYQEYLAWIAEGNEPEVINEV